MTHVERLVRRGYKSSAQRWAFHCGGILSLQCRGCMALNCRFLLVGVVLQRTDALVFGGCVSTQLMLRPRLCIVIGFLVVRRPQLNRVCPLFPRLQLLRDWYLLCQGASARPPPQFFCKPCGPVTS